MGTNSSRGRRRRQELPSLAACRRSDGTGLPACALLRNGAVSGGRAEAPAVDETRGVLRGRVPTTAFALKQASVDRAMDLLGRPRRASAECEDSARPPRTLQGFVCASPVSRMTSPDGLFNARVSWESRRPPVRIAAAGVEGSAFAFPGLRYLERATHCRLHAS
jgi:hypothetical protein